jgi:hypothetical protein
LDTVSDIGSQYGMQYGESSRHFNEYSGSVVADIIHSSNSQYGMFFEIKFKEK